MRHLFSLVVLLLLVILTTLHHHVSSADVSKLPPDAYVTCETTKGSMEIGLVTAWSPLGVKRFLELVDDGFLTTVPLFRCISNFLCQFGYKSARGPRYSTIADDPPLPELRRFQRGYVSFAGGGKNTRDNHLFFTLGERVGSLGREPWETPLGFISDVSPGSPLARLYTGYGDFDTGPKIERIMKPDGDKYIAEKFPLTDYIKSCRRGRTLEEAKGGALASSAVEQEKTTKNTAEIVEDEKAYVVLELGEGLGTVKIELFLKTSFLGAPRFRKLAESGYLDGTRFYRVIPGFVVQFGFPAVPENWDPNAFPPLVDEGVMGSNTRGVVSFASSGPNTRSTQLFINLGDNSRLDAMDFQPIGKVVDEEGMRVVEKIYSGYREKPDQGMISKMGNEYLNKEFPQLSFIRKASVLVVVGGRGGSGSGAEAESEEAGGGVISSSSDSAEEGIRRLKGRGRDLFFNMGALVIVGFLLLSCAYVARLSLPSAQLGEKRDT